MTNSESRKRLQLEQERRERVESFAVAHELRREAARTALGHVMTCPSFADADALLLGLEDAGARLVVDQEEARHLGETARARTGDGPVSAANMPEPVFVLDLAENPHPRMLAEALEARANKLDSAEALWYWRGYLAAMAGATGCDRSDIEAWMDAHQVVPIR